MSTIAFAVDQKILHPLAYADTLGRVFEEVPKNTLESSQTAHYVDEPEHDVGEVKKENLPAYFAQIDKTFDTLEAQSLEELREVLSEARDRLIMQVRRGSANAKSFRLARVPALRSALRDLLERAQKRGRADAVADLQQVKSFTKPLPQFAPRQAMKWLRAKEFFITDLLDSQITESARGVLVNALKNGELAGRTIEKLWLLFEPYVGDPSVLRDGSPLSPHRLETIVRTNTVEAYNHGRMMEYTREEMLPFLTALRYSAILDTRTTPVCQFLHGKLFDPISPDLTDLLPPNHFNCRSVIVPVMIGEKVQQDDFATDADIGHAKELADARFLTAWDESLHPRHPPGSDQGGEFAPKGGGEGGTQTSDPRVQRLRAASKLPGTKASIELIETFDVPPPPLSEEYVEAVSSYVDSGYRVINYGLREPNEPGAALNGRAAAQVTALDAAIENAVSLHESVIVYRGVVAGFNLREGDVFEDRGFLSTSVSEKLGKIFGDTVFEIEAPPGTKFLPVASYLKSAARAEVVGRGGVRSLDRAIDFAMDEAELLFARGTKMRIKSVQTSLDGKHSYYKAEIVNG